MNAGLLFEGIGGFGLACERAGIEKSWSSENDRHASAVLDHHWPHIKNLGDIHQIRGARYTKATRPRYLTDRDKADATRFYEAGESIEQVAERFAVTRQAMHDVLKRRTEMRPAHRFGENNHFHRGTEAERQAHRKVERAIQKGQLSRPDRCQRCGTSDIPMRDGRTRIQAHHPDYNKPLEVLWLCQECHHDEHKEGGGRNGVLAEPVDVLVGGFP